MNKLVFKLQEPSLDSVSEEEKHQQQLLSNFDCFIGARKTVAENLAKRIQKECGIFVITGTSGCGKTTFAVSTMIPFFYLKECTYIHSCFPFFEVNLILFHVT